VRLASECEADELNELGQWIRSGKADDGTHRFALKAIAATRLAEREAVAAWLRSLAGSFITPPILCFIGDPFSRDSQILCADLADAIDRGEHRNA